MDGFKNNYAEWENPDQKQDIPCDSMHPKLKNGV